MADVLIITRDFPPYCNKVGWMVRATAMANFFVSQGHTPHVLCTRRAAQWQLLPVVEGVVRHPLTHPLSIFDLPREKAANPMMLATKAAKRLILAAVGQRLVDIDHLFASQFEAAARRLIEAYRIRHVVITTPPHSLQLVGMRLKQRYGDRLQVIADFRDPWTTKPKYIKKDAAAQKAMEALERDVFATVDAVVVVTPGARDAFAKLYPDLQHKLHIVQNGFLHVPAVEPPPAMREFAAEARRQGRVILGFFGSVGVGAPRNDAKRLNALYELCDQRPEFARGFALVVQGEFDQGRPPPDGLSLLTLPPASNAEARANMRLIDLGLLVYEEKRDAAQLLGGKLYDYAASEIGIWMIVPDNAASLIGFAAETGKPFISDVHTPATVEAAATSILALARAGRLSDRFYRAQESTQYARDEQLKGFLKLFDSL